jgi:hypothetical protein
MDVKLKTKHIIMLSKLVAKLNIDLDMTEKDPVKLGMNVMYDLVKKIYMAETEFYELIGSIANISPAVAAETNIEEITDLLQEVVKKIANFIQSRKGSATST